MLALFALPLRVEFLPSSKPGMLLLLMDKISFLVVWQYHHKDGLTLKKGIASWNTENALSEDPQCERSRFFFKKKKVEKYPTPRNHLCHLVAKRPPSSTLSNAALSSSRIFFSSWTPGSNSSSFPTFNRTPRAGLLHEKLTNGVHRAALPNPSCANSLGMIRFDDLFNMTHVRPPRLSSLRWDRPSSKFRERQKLFVPSSHEETCRPAKYFRIKMTSVNLAVMDSDVI